MFSVVGVVNMTVAILFILQLQSTVIAFNTSCSYSDSTLLCEDYINLNGMTFTQGPIQRLILRPAKERRNSFDDELIVFFQKIRNDYQEGFSVELENFVDFDIAFNPFTLTDKMGSLIVIDNSVLQFKLNGLLNFNCTSTLAITQQKFFSKFKEIRFELGVIYRENLCPIVFANSQLSKLTFKGIDYRENPFSFGRLLGDASLLGASSERAEILQANLRVLSDELLYLNIFREATHVVYEAINPSDGLVEIQNEIFRFFRTLKRFDLALNNWETFVKTSNGDWLFYLNVNRSASFEFRITDQSHSYEFPDEDFCFFSKLAANRIGTTIIEGKESLECSCTLAWLLQNTAQTTQTSTTENCYAGGPTIPSEFVSACNFTDRLLECSQTSTTTQATTRTTIVTTRAIEQKPKQDTTTIVFSVIGGVILIIILGLVVFTIYRNKSKQEKKQQKANFEDENINIVPLKK